MKEKFVKIPNKSAFMDSVEAGARIIRMRGNHVIADLRIHAFGPNRLIVSDWSDSSMATYAYEWAKMFHFSHVLEDLNAREGVQASEVAVSGVDYNWQAGDVIRIRQQGRKNFTEYQVRTDSPASNTHIAVTRISDERYGHAAGGNYRKTTFFAGLHVNIVTSAGLVKKPMAKDKNAAKKKKEFILWCPTSNLPPRVIMRDGLEAAKGVAEDMARRHGTVFYVCELVAKAQVATIQQVRVADL